MGRWLEIVLTLVLFAVAMSAVGWVVNATVPDMHGWLIANIGRAGAWALLIAVVLAAGIYGYLDHRKAGTKPKGT